MIMSLSQTYTRRPNLTKTKTQFIIIRVTKFFIKLNLSWCLFLTCSSQPGNILFDDVSASLEESRVHEFGFSAANAMSVIGMNDIALSQDLNNGKSDVTGDLPTRFSATRSTSDMINACFTCEATSRKASSLIDQCQNSGRLEECGSDSVCIIEIRTRNSVMTSVKTGCKERRACEDQQKQNFGPGPLWRTQCRPENNLTGGRFGPSVCRQCFSTCEGDSQSNTGNTCFSPAHGIYSSSGALSSFNILSPGTECVTTNCEEYGRSWWASDLTSCQEDSTLTNVNECNNGAFPTKFDRNQNYPN